jgi:hypothetical protein
LLENGPFLFERQVTGREFVIAVAEGGLPDEAGDKQPQQPMGHVTMRGPGLSRMT